MKTLKPSESQVCNIGGREVSKRRWGGIVALLACVAIETFFVVADWSRWWRIALLPLLYFSIIGFLQAHERVCVRNAVNGVRNLGAGDKAIESDLEKHALRGRGITIIIQSALGALIVTAILIVLHF